MGGISNGTKHRSKLVRAKGDIQDSGPNRFHGPPTTLKILLGVRRVPGTRRPAEANLLPSWTAVRLRFRPEGSANNSPVWSRASGETLRCGEISTHRSLNSFSAASLAARRQWEPAPASVGRLSANKSTEQRNSEHIAAVPILVHETSGDGFGE